MRVYMGEDRLVVTQYGPDNWGLVDQRGNAYFRGTLQRIKEHVGEMVLRGTYRVGGVRDGCQK